MNSRKEASPRGEASFFRLAPSRGDMPPAGPRGRHAGAPITARLLQQLCTAFAATLHGFCRSAARLLQRRCTAFAGVLHNYCSDASRLLQRMRAPRAGAGGRREEGGRPPPPRSRNRIFLREKNGIRFHVCKICLTLRAALENNINQ